VNYKFIHVCVPLRASGYTRSQKNARGGGSAPDTDALNCRPLPRWGSGVLPQKKIWNFVRKIMRFCAYLHSTAVRHGQCLTKCREYIVMWALVGGLKPLVEGLEPSSAPRWLRGWRQSDKAVSYGIVFTLFVCLCAHLCADIYGTVTDGGLAPISHIYLSLEERSMNWTWMSIYYQIISRIWGEGPHHHHITATGCLCMCLCLSASVYVCLSVSVRLKVIRRKRGIQAHLSVCLSVCVNQSINQSVYWSSL